MAKNRIYLQSDEILIVGHMFDTEIWANRRENRSMAQWGILPAYRPPYDLMYRGVVFVTNLQSNHVESVSYALLEHWYPVTTERKTHMQGVAYGVILSTTAPHRTAALMNQPAPGAPRPDAIRYLGEFAISRLQGCKADSQIDKNFAVAALGVNHPYPELLAEMIASYYHPAESEFVL
jgi:hypothetical protein